MKYFSACLLLLLLFCYPVPVLADYQKAYTDYTYSFSQYRASYNDYQVAKSSYSTYKTLTSQSEAITKLRTVLQARNDLVSAYYDLLQEKLLATPNILDDQRNTFFKMKESEKQWMATHKKKVDAASSLEDLNSVAAEFESRYPQMDSETKQAIGMVLLSKEAAISSRWETVTSQVSDQLKVINSTGEETVVGERGIIAARNKKELADTKIGQAREIFFPKNNAYPRIDLFSAQQRLTESLQYLREGTNYLVEIIKNITG